MRRIVLVGRSVGLMLEALSLEARTRGKDRRRKLSASLSPLLSSLEPYPVSFLLSLLSPYLSNNAPLCSATLEPRIFLDAMDFPKAFRDHGLASPRFLPSVDPSELLIEPIINRWLESSYVSTNRIARTFAKRGTWPLPDDDIPARERIERSQNEPRMRARGWFVRFGWRARTEADRMSQTSGNESAGC